MDNHFLSKLLSTYNDRYLVNKKKITLILLYIVPAIFIAISMVFLFVVIHEVLEIYLPFVIVNLIFTIFFLLIGLIFYLSLSKKLADIKHEEEKQHQSLLPLIVSSIVVGLLNKKNKS